MNKILVEVSVGELLDKISILEIKTEKINVPFRFHLPVIAVTDHLQLQVLHLQLLHVQLLHLQLLQLQLLRLQFLQLQ